MASANVLQSHPSENGLTSSGKGVCLGTMAKYPTLGAVLWGIALRHINGQLGGAALQWCPKRLLPKDLREIGK